MRKLWFACQWTSSSLHARPKAAIRLCRTWKRCVLLLLLESAFLHSWRTFQLLTNRAADAWVERFWNRWSQVSEVQSTISSWASQETPQAKATDSQIFIHFTLYYCGIYRLEIFLWSQIPKTEDKTEWFMLNWTAVHEHRNFPDRKLLLGFTLEWSILRGR